MDARNIELTDKMLIKADKTSNFYHMTTQEYHQLLHNQVTKDYKKTDRNSIQSINVDAKKIAQSLDINDRIPKIIEREAFITLKDHKQNFTNKPTCRLINPTKSEIGKISKKILDNINQLVRKKLESTYGRAQQKS